MNKIAILINKDNPSKTLSKVSVTGFILFASQSIFASISKNCNKKSATPSANKESTLVATNIFTAFLL